MIRSGLPAAFLALLLTGCKVEIDMPEGGYISTRSGLYACAAGETCTIEVDHPFLAEVFQAFPAEGYEFVAWESGDGHFCQNSSKPCALNTYSFPLFPVLMEILGGDYVFYLKPVFRQIYYQPPSADGDFRMLSTHRQEHYLVEGDSAGEILNSTQSDANPEKFMPRMGGKYVAVASAASNYNWWYRFDEQGCRVTRFELSAQYTTLLPQLVNVKQKPDWLKREWRNWYLRVLAHEAGHHQINRSQHEKQLEAIKSTESPWDYTIRSIDECREASKNRVLELVEPIQGETGRLQDAYHADVGTSTPWYPD